GIFQLLYTISWIGICVVVLVDIGSAFFGDMLLFYALKEILSLSIFSRLLILAYLFMVFKGTIRLTRTILRTESYIIQSRINGIAFANGLIAIGLSVIVIYIQGALFGEMRFLYGSNQINLIYEFLIGGILFLTPSVLFIINGIRYIRLESVSREAKRKLIPINLFVSLGYIVVVKAFSIYVLYNTITRAIAKKRGKHIELDDEDLLLLGTTINNKNIIGKINTYFLLSSFVVFFLLFYISSSPYPILKTAYVNGHFMMVMSVFSVLLFYITEQISRALKWANSYMKLIFIPSFIAIFVWSFFTDNSQMSANIVDSKAFSIFHQLSRTLGNDRYIMFICLFLLVACLGYMMHIIAGEIDHEKHAITLIPIIGWLQVLIGCIWYPLLIVSPPYSIVTHEKLLIVIISVLIVLLVVSVSTISHYIFTSEKSNVSLYITSFWKKKWRVYLIVSLITLAIFTPIFMKIVKPISDTGISEIWTADYIPSDDFTITKVIPELYKGTGLLLASMDNEDSRLLLINPKTGEIDMDKTYEFGIESYYLWGSDKIVLLKTNNEGFMVIDLSNYRIDYEETVVNPSSYEYLAFEISEHAVLVTKGSEQYLYDVSEGYMTLKTVGNNFYQLVPGDQTVLYKNNTLNRIMDGGLVSTGIALDLNDYEFLYALDNGYIAYDENQLFMVDLMFEAFIGESYDFSNNPLITNEVDSFDYKRYKDYFIMNHTSDGIPYAYLFDIGDFKTTVLKLVDKVKTFSDNQDVYVYNESGDYVLYDDYQISVYEQDNMIAKLWFELSDVDSVDVSQTKLEPVIINHTLIWYTYTGEAQCVDLIDGGTDTDGNN
nr:hypothetical protein [Vallitaleaceae bacterium]